MIWKTTNGLGQEVTWYSQEEVKETVDSLLKVQYQLADSCKKYKQTLTEIKEIAEKNLNIHTCAFKGCGYDLITKQILQKISEVEDAQTNS